MKIKGYKLRDEKNARAAFYAAGFMGDYKKHSNPQMQDIFYYKSKAVENLRDSGVLDVWFEPVYENIEHKKFKGTKGEWKITDNNPFHSDGSKKISISINEGSIDVYNNIGGVTRKEAEANAKLIVAAPYLLEAAKKGLEAIKKLHDHQEGCQQDEYFIDSVIKKAI